MIALFLLVILLLSVAGLLAYFWSDGELNPVFHAWIITVIAILATLGLDDALREGPVAGIVVDTEHTGQVVSNRQVYSHTEIVNGQPVVCYDDVVDVSPAVSRLLISSEDGQVWIEVPFEVLTAVSEGDWYSQ